MMENVTCQNQNSELNKIKDWIFEAKRIAVISHIRPDCDTLGSSFGLGEALLGMGKAVTFYCADPVPEKYDFLKFANCVVNEPIQNVDLVISVDCSDSLRMGIMAEGFKSAQRSALLDHHRSNTREGKINVVREDYSSCSELIFDLITLLGVPVTHDIALPLYLGLSSDTGNFSHSNVNEHSFTTAAKLKGAVGDISTYIYKLFKDNPKPRFLLLAHTLTNARFYLDDKLCILSVMRDDIEIAGADSSMTEGFVDYAVNCTPCEVGVSVLESSDNNFKISWRSKGVIDVCEIAGEYGGGGHTRAAGCVLCGFYEDVIDRIVRSVRNAFPF